MNGHERRRCAKMGQIEAAALQLFREQGVAATSIEQIAAEAGVSKVSIYRYYGDKLALARQIIFDLVDRQSEAFSQMMGSALPFRKKFSQMYAAKVQELSGMTGDGATGGLLQGELLASSEVSAFLREYAEQKGLPLLRALIEQGVREGEITGDIPVETILLYMRSFQSLLAAPITARQRTELGRLFQYGLKGEE